MHPSPAFKPETRAQLKRAVDGCLKLPPKVDRPNCPHGLAIKTGNSKRYQDKFYYFDKTAMLSIDIFSPSPGSSSRISLLDLRKEGLVHAKFLRRPSSRNRSPYGMWVRDKFVLKYVQTYYRNTQATMLIRVFIPTPVADVELADGREAITHMGGRFKEGTELLLRPARDSKGTLVGNNSLGKHGTPKCEFIIQLVRVSEPENEHIGVWVGVHPSLAEQLTYEMLKRGLVKELGELVDIKREVAKVCGTDMRVDFVVTHKDGTRTALEVKKVDNTDYNPAIIRVEGGVAKTKYWGYGIPYRRAAIFPWGGSQSKRGPDGEKIVPASARAIKHIDELTAVQTGEKLCQDGERLKAAILFIIGRCDAQSLRSNKEACPSFAKHLQKANERGVKVLAYRVAWGTGDEEGVAFFDGALKVDL